MVWLSVGLRAIVNVEALNMVESIGNIVRHRKAAIVYRRQDGSYVLRYVPAVSGESMAHAYQSWLVHLSKERKLPVCEFCEKEEFVKHAQPELFGKSKWEEDLKLSIEASKSKGKSKEEKESQKSQELSIIVEKIEEEIVRNCVVEDIGGFLFAGENPVKRTSRFYASYMVPSFDALDKSSLEPQMQVRHAPTASLLYKQAQMPYSVEVGSAVYSWSSMLDLGSIGICSYSTTKQAIKEDERINRIKLAIDALSLMLESGVFGAKRTRFNPLIEYESLLIAVSRNLPFTASPPSVRDYVARTVGRIKPLMNN
ncbi:MAG: DevR family CRISPR-associated autoregulator, partial [Candidatus Methanodesulfokora sp.]